MGAVKFEPIAKATDPDAAKRREVNIGLANNATGAAFGAIATGQAASVARSNYRRLRRDPNAPEPPKSPSLAQRGYRAVAGRSPRVARIGARVRPHLTGKNAAKGALVFGGLNVAGQLANAGLDAQSGAYFARERKDLARKRKEGVVKSDNGIGTFYEREVVRKDAWVDPEVKRQRQLSATSTAGGLTGVGALGYAGRNALRASTATGEAAVVHTMKMPTWTKNAQGRKVRGKDAPREIPVRNADGSLYRYRTYNDSLGGNIKQAFKNMKRSGRRKIGIPAAGGAALLGLSGAAHRMGHGKNERPWS